MSTFVFAYFVVTGIMPFFFRTLSEAMLLKYGFIMSRSANTIFFAVFDRLIAKFSETSDFPMS